MDMSEAIKPKSNQLNADDLLAGPKTILITNVTAGQTKEQPVVISYEGDGGRPYLPCKSMCRVLVAVWGVNAQNYVGRRLTVFRDPSVVFGGVETGGIRISHMSDMSAPELKIALAVTRSRRAPYVVTRLAGDRPPARPAATPAPAQPTPAPVAPPPAGAPPEPARQRIIPAGGPAPAAPVRRIANTPESTP